MSNRVLRKLKGGEDDMLRASREKAADNGSGSDSESEPDKAPKSESSRPGTGAKSKKLAINRFELLNSFENNSHSDTEAKEDDDRDQELLVGSNELTTDKNKLEKQDSTQSTDSLKRKKKKKKKVRNQKSLENQLNSPQDEIEKSVLEVNRILGELPLRQSNHKSDHKAVASHKSVLYVENRNLNPENEMKRIFGSKVVQAEQASIARRRGRGKAAVGRSWLMANPRNWQNIGKPPISMELTQTVGDNYHFNFIHSRTYQSIQFLFLDAVESYNPDNLVAILNAHPYHIDTLIQFSDVCKMEDSQTAAELIERALYCFESVFHPSFNVAQGNCRIDYLKAENRSLYISLFKHLMFVGQRGCNRTSLEFCKVILSFDPEGDPLSVLLMIDFYAIRSEQYDYLVQMYKEWEPLKKLSLFPNFRFSVPLALFLKSIHGNRDKTSILDKTADELLQEALIMFPSLLPNLLDKCGVETDREVAQCSYFTTSVQQMPQAIAHMVALYVGRCFLLWKDKDVLLWLETNVREVIKRVNAKDPLIEEFGELRKKYFGQGTPRNVLRHIILSGIKEATVTLPPDLTQSPIYGFDPLPPLDNIVTYSRPAPTASSRAADQGILSLFLRSWLPDFNTEDQLRNLGAVGGQNNVEARGEHPRREEATEGNDFRRSVTSLLDAMRDLLNNVQMADLPNEGDVESDDDQDQRPQRR